MPPATLVHDAQQALLLVVAVSLPVLGVAAIVGLLTAAIQAATQIQDPTLAHLPRLIAVVAAIPARTCLPPAPRRGRVDRSGAVW